VHQELWTGSVPAAGPRTPQWRDERARPARAVAARERPGARFKLLGFPTRVDASFLLIVGLIGYDGSGSHLAIWVAVALVSVLGPRAGSRPGRPAHGGHGVHHLAGLGGLTRSTGRNRWAGPSPPSSVPAGPLAGILLGLPVLYALHTLGWPSWTDGGYALRSAAFTTLGWSALNLLPMLPLDGGHLLEMALPGPPVARAGWRRSSRSVSPSWPGSWPRRPGCSTGCSWP